MIGAGYVGLVSGACFADFGHDVVCVDKDANKIRALNNNEIPIFEPGLLDIEGWQTFVLDRDRTASALGRCCFHFSWYAVTPRQWTWNQAPIIYTTRRTAELIKYAATAFLAMKITFINEIADLCEKVGADVQEVARGIGLDNRIGSKFLHAGPGYGGSCFPKDVRAIIKTAQDHDVSLRLLEAVEKANETGKRAMARKVAAMFGANLRDKVISVLGLTFKPNSDDMREAPSIALITALQDMGARCAHLTRQA